MSQSVHKLFKNNFSLFCVTLIHVNTQMSLDTAYVKWVACERYALLILLVSVAPHGVFLCCAPEANCFFHYHLFHSQKKLFCGLGWVSKCMQSPSVDCLTCNAAHMVERCLIFPAALLSFLYLEFMYFSINFHRHFLHGLKL